jgi:3-hydroxyisobutyrate dehydrogenase-like beta-hydroxyacid dehydrogenase
MSASSGVPVADVAVLGCGNMGSAIARALASAGRKVVVWNRTPSKAEALVSENIVSAGSVAEAAASAKVVILTVALYDDALALLADFDGAQPEVVLNLTTGNNQEPARALAMCSELGLNYLDGVIVCYPQNVGKKETVLLIGGEQRLWDRASELILDLGGSSRYVGADVCGPTILDTGVVGAYYMAALGAFFEALAYMLDEGASPDDILATLQATSPQLEVELEEAVHAAVGRSYPTDQVTLDVVMYGIRGFESTVSNSAHPANHLRETIRLGEMGERANLGQLALYSLVEVLRKNK